MLVVVAAATVAIDLFASSSFLSQSPLSMLQYVWIGVNPSIKYENVY